MSSTLGTLVDRVRTTLRSYSDLERATYLTGAVDAAVTELAVADGDVVATGVVEIDDELIRVSSTSGGTLTVPPGPGGRGVMGSTAAAHALYAEVIVDPQHPRQHIKNAIIDTQRALYPTLFAPKAHEFTYAAAVSAYNMPTDVDRILSISWQTSGGSGHWQPVKHYRLDGLADPESFADGNALHVFDGIQPGRTVRVVYAAPFTELSASADTLAAAGHQASHADVLVYGACWRLIQFVDATRLNLDNVENQERGKFAQPGGASALTRQILAIYERRLQEERMRLLQLYPITMRFNR